MKKRIISIVTVLLSLFLLIGCSNDNSQIEQGSNSNNINYVASIDDLQNTENFKDGALEHILEGEVNRRGKAVGYHYEGFVDSKGSVIEGTRTEPDELGVYVAKVEVDGVAKESNGGRSTFFPEDWTPQEVVDAINEAYEYKEFVTGSTNTYVGELENGMQIQMYIDQNTDKIISAFPTQ